MFILTSRMFSCFSPQMFLIISNNCCCYVLSFGKNCFISLKLLYLALLDSLNLTISTASILGGCLKCGFYYDLGVMRLTEQEMTAAVEKVTCYSSQGAGNAMWGLLGRDARRQHEQGELQTRERALLLWFPCKRLTRQSKQAEGFRLAKVE